MTDPRTEQPDHIIAAAAEATLDEQIAELKRELSIRRNVYAGFVRSGRLTQPAADKQTARLLAALHTLMRYRDQLEEESVAARRAAATELLDGLGSDE